MQAPTLLFILVSLLIGACGMKGDLFEPPPPAAPVAGPDAAPEASETADPDKDGRKTIPRTPAPEQSQ